MESIEYPEGWNKERLEKEAKKEKVLLLEDYDKKNVKYIKIKDLISRYSLSKTKSGVLLVKDKWDSTSSEYVSSDGTVEVKVDQVAKSWERTFETYDWEGLENSIKTHGIKKPLLAGRKGGYVADGNHRLAVLKLLYSPDKKVPCVESLKRRGPSFLVEREEQLEFHKNERRFALENDIAFQHHADVGKIIKIYK